MDIDNILYFFVVTTTLVKTVETLINAIAHQNDTFSLPCHLGAVLTLCIQVLLQHNQHCLGERGMV